VILEESVVRDPDRFDRGRFGDYDDFVPMITDDRRERRDPGGVTQLETCFVRGEVDVEGGCPGGSVGLSLRREIHVPDTHGVTAGSFAAPFMDGSTVGSACPA